MEFNPQRLRLVLALAILSLSVAACHSGPSSGSSGYVPTSPSDITAPQSNMDMTPAAKDIDIHSSCGHRIHIVIAGIIDCKFRERGYGNGTFTLQDHTNGLILISPTSGNRHTTFTITGVLVGSGHFTVRDKKGNHLNVRVRVTL